MLLALLYWIILILSALGLAFPAWPPSARYGPWIVLFVLIGLRAFPVSLQ